LFFFYCLVSIAWSDFADVAFKRWVKALGDVVMVLVVLTDANPVVAIKRFLARVGFVLVPVSILFIKYFPDLGRAYEPGFGVWTPMYTGVTTTKNLLGMITLVTGLGAMWRFLHMQRAEDGSRKKGQLLAEAALLAMVFWLLHLANSATSLSCFLMAGTLILLTSRGWFRQIPWLIHSLVFAMVAVSSFALFSSSGGGLLGTLGRDSTLTGRTDIWTQVLSMADNPVFGTGFESFWLGTRLQKIWDLWWWHPNEAHNGYIEVYINLGWMGLTLLGILLINGYRNIIATFRTKPEMAEIKLAFFLVAVIYDFTESAIRTMNPIWILFLLSIIAVPDTPAPEEDLPILTRRTDQLAEREPQFQTVARAGLRQHQEIP
jgi:O-antigen ligase